MDNGASSYRRFLEGDDDGIVQIIRDYKDGLMLYLNSFVQNIHIAEDLTEDTFVKLIARRPRFSGKSTFKTWLYSIGRNVALDYLRKNSKLPTVSTEETVALLSDEADIAGKYLQTERKLQVHEAMKGLNKEYRQVLDLIYFEELQNEQVAFIMGKSKKQIENLVYRAKLSLKSAMEKEGFVYENL
ncbi:MAG: RNA polymerase sigma factor [Ruminococcaceae bacterium]|nr:RNA polymerase sigma factor [Oscillospiraceae bacterium]